MNEKEKESSSTVPDWDTFCRIAFRERFTLDRAEFVRKLQEAEEASESENQEAA